MTQGPSTIRVFAGDGFGENTWLVHSETTAVVVDPGAAAPDVRDALAAEGRTLDAILLTHAHLDHVEGIPALTGGTAVPIWLHPSDRPLYDAAPVQAAAFGVRIPTLPPPDHALVPGEEVVVGDLRFAVRHAPGHSPGHVLLVREEDGVAFCGDVVFRGSIGRTDLPGGDYGTLMRSIQTQVLSLADQVRLLPGHGPESTVGIERHSNPFLAGL